MSRDGREYLYVFSSAEGAALTQEARRRIHAHRKTKRVDRRRLRNEALGIAGELVVARWLGLDDAPAWSHLGPRGDGGESDNTLPDGRTVEVKTTTHKRGALIVPQY